MLLLIAAAFCGLVYEAWQVKTMGLVVVASESDGPEYAQYSQAEIAAKAMGYWEQQMQKAQTADEKAECFGHIRDAQLALIHCTGDFVPPQAKTPLNRQTTPVVQQSVELPPPPENVVCLLKAKDLKHSADFFDD